MHRQETMNSTVERRNRGTSYRLWLKIRVGESLASEESALTASAGGRVIKIQSDRPSERLSVAQWLVLECGGFSTSSAAQRFGEKLRRAVHVAGLSARVGVDARDPGQDRTLSWVSPAFAREIGALESDMRIGPDVHGLVVLPDDGTNAFVRAVPATGRALPNAGHFVKALEQALAASGENVGDQSAIRRSILVLNLAEMNHQPIAKAMLAISAVESLATEPPWTVEQKNIIDGMADGLQQAHGDDEQIRPVVAALRNLRAGSIRQRIKRLLMDNGLSGLWQGWEELYGRRSRLLHGQGGGHEEYRGETLEEAELHALAQDAVKLCARIVLSIAKREGVTVPDRAGVHFGVV